MSRFQLVLLDADGTLFDYDRAEAAALEQSFAHYQLAYSSCIRDGYRQINTRLWKQLEEGRISKATLQHARFEQLFATCSFHIDVVKFNDTYLDYLAQTGHLLDGALEVCEVLSRHCILAIATNGIARTQKKRLENSAINAYIRYMIVSEDAGWEKPHAGLFDYAFAVCGHHDRNSTIIVGDSFSADIRGGRDYGITTCWYNPTDQALPQALAIDYQIRHLKELPELLI